MRISDWSSDVCSSDLCPASSCRAIPLYAPDARQRQRRPVTLRRAARLRRHQQRLADRLPLLRRRPGQFRAHLRQRVLADAAVPLPVLAGELALLEGMNGVERSEEHTSELQSLMRTSYAVFCLKKTNNI